ncbi:uncharacterized protein K444DRAFT_644904 [Hyaloscypha bicolor E]|uniref:Uncharacterized protein n=1 Tax=Hyaloscypha bicolor E TaxID=1095630 RepID=A0A2J6T2T9_9HELO|nr:uncharacterized protein K444DRAFT_644904 [Hyaloscypha bicolor E]PMD57317.1 hypothetical protein K444DRAFT_644904 [Hyaloscypha bicolor E]
MMDFQGSGLPRSKNISDARHPKRRRLCDNSFEEVLPYPHAVSNPALGHHEYDYTDLVVVGEEETQVQCSSRCESNVEASSINVTDDELLECCYGMLSKICVRLRHPSNVPLPSHLPVTFRAPNTLSSLSNASAEFEIQSDVHSKILSELHGLEDVTTQMYCCSSLELPRQSFPPNAKRRSGKISRVWRLNVIIYGSVMVEDVVGQYLSKNRMYLQDPVDCERNVLYRNPHMISTDGGIVMTDSFMTPPIPIEVERLSIGPDLLAQLMAEQTSLPEMEPPSTVTTALFRHQKQALTFMVRREQGWDLKSTGDIWIEEDSEPGCRSYRNTVNGCSRTKPPPCFRGGLLADDMGLGKTLSMISLIATNQYLKSPPYGNSAYENELCHKLKATLLIVPPPLIQAWQKQLNMHIRPGTFHLHVYHGQNRKEIEKLQHCDVVITTFQTLSSAWRKQRLQVVQDPIFSVTWHRVILDEAHTIQNAQSQLAQACCALQAERRWAITGTPIQNKLTDFSSILKFLQVYPYDDQKIFDEEISHPWHLANREGFLRLKSLVRAITISRTKTVIKLPARVDEIHHLEFSSEESDGYNAAKKETIALFEEAISSNKQGGKTFNALTRLNFLRIFCNLGLCDVCDSFYSNILDGSALCTQCGQALLEDLLEGTSRPDFDCSPNITRMPSLCDNCKSDSSSHQSGLTPFFQREQSDVSAASSAPSTPSNQTQTLLPLESIPTKIKALVADLSTHCLTEKCVVFSFWTSTLDLVQYMLDESEIIYTRIDGKMSLGKRTECMRLFQTDDTVRVILVSITCGGAGLDLTAGSRAYLLEPHWNPMIEEQALCRVHRVGQKREVTTVRYLIRGSFEEQVVEIQKRKKKLAEVTFGSGQMSEDGINLGTLLASRYLKSVLE